LTLNSEKSDFSAQSVQTLNLPDLSCAAVSSAMACGPPSISEALSGICPSECQLSPAFERRRIKKQRGKVPSKLPAFLTALFLF